MELMKMQVGGWRVRPTRDPCCPLPPRERVVTSLDSVSSPVAWKEEKGTSGRSFQIALGKARVVPGVAGSLGTQRVGRGQPSAASR